MYRITKYPFVFYIFLSKNLKIRFSDHFFVGPEAESAYSMTSLTISDLRNAWRETSVSSWK
jgi:hypothetical protein